MKIDILCNDGSPLGVSCVDIFGENGRVGVGGSELALLTLAEAWSNKHEVTLYNNPYRGWKSPFEQRMIRDFDASENRDILIIFRSPNPKAECSKGKKIWWSCDQFTVGNFKRLSESVDKIVTISPYHSEFFKSYYGIENTIPIDLPVRLQDYAEPLEKENKLIFTSVPDRGLHVLLDIFPRIHKETGATLTITSDYRLWGAGANNGQYVQRIIGMDGIEYLGAVPRKRLILEQLKSKIQLYPFSRKWNAQPELFCIAIAEAQAAGVLPITSSEGALNSTNMGVIINGVSDDIAVKELFIQKTIEYLRSPDLPRIQSELSKRAKERFSLDAILKTWDEVFNE